MYCTNCQKLKTRKLKVSSLKLQQQRCEHCGFSIDEKAQRLNSAGLPTDSKGSPKPVERSFIPPPRRWINA